MAEESSESVEPAPELVLPEKTAILKLPLEVLLELGEAISCISTYKANLYLGTTHGLLLHYYIFDDAEEYILIMKLLVQSGENCAIKKLLVVPDVEMCLVLCNRVIYPYTLPELSPCRIGKIKDVNDMSKLSQVKNPKVKNKHDKIIVYTSSKIRVVQLLQDSVKLLRDIAYVGAVAGLSSAAGTLANYSNICLVANDKNYDVVDLQHTRRISLFDYNPGQLELVEPHIVPFTPQNQENSSEEYMLTICSDKSNSMAMFMNALGDVTRGTLAWLQEGYPTRGVAIQWPYVIGLFQQEDSPMKLTFSSLTTLEVVFSVDFQEFMASKLNLGTTDDISLLRVEEGITLADPRLLDLLEPVSCDGTATAGSKKEFAKLNVIFHNKESLFCLYKESELSVLIESLQSSLERADNDELEKLMLKLDGQEPKSFVSKAEVLVTLALGKFEDLKQMISNDDSDSLELDPRFILLVDDRFPDGNEVWTDFKIEKSLLRMAQSFKNRTLDAQFEAWLIKKVHDHKDQFEELVWQYFRAFRYEKSESTANTKSLVLGEKAIWQDQSKYNEKLMSSIEANRDYLILFIILEIKQELNDRETNALQIVELGFSILSGASTLRDSYTIEDGVLAVDGEVKDLVELIFFQLRNHVNDGDIYTKKLLELLKLFPDRGLKLLQANKGGKHKSTHRFIFQELSSTYSIDTAFSSLKVEYLELTFVEHLAESKVIDSELLDELFLEMTKYLEENLDKYEVALENLKILSATFKLEVNLSDLTWPKLSWIEFLHLHGRKDDSKELVEIYLKLYELLVAKSLSNKTIRPVLADRPGFDYLSHCFSDTSQSGLIAFLLKQGDYSVAEWVAVHGKMPLPRKSIYFEAIKHQLLEKYSIRAHTEVQRSTKQLFGFYLDLDDLASRDSSIRHLVRRFGRAYYEFGDLMSMLPDDFPLVYIQDYLTTVVLELEAQKANSVMVKTMSKLDSKFTERVWKDFEQTNNDALVVDNLTS